MIANVVIAPLAEEAIRNQVVDGPPFDEPPKVSLLQGDWLAADPTTWPAVAATVPAINGTAAEPWEILFDAVEGNFKLVAPEPVGGWDFVSSGEGDSITGFKVEVASDVAQKIGASRFLNPIPLVGADQHIMLPNVSLPLANLLSPVVQPMELD